MTQIKITITNKDKKAELELSDVDQLDKLLIIQSVFKLFDIDLDALEFSKSYKQINKAYDGFFKSMQSEEPQTKLNMKDISKQLETGLQDTQMQTQETQFWNSGTKVRDGQTVYVCHYECHVCNDRGNHYIPEGTIEVKCRSCRSLLKVYDAHPEGFGVNFRDSYGNFFRAGEFRDWKLWD